MGTKHTPGPWEAVQSTGGDTFAIFGPRKNDIIAQLLEVLPPNVVAANARLIAAAPDLLQACKALLSLFDDPCPYDAASTRGAARAAIAKAEGRGQS